MPADLEQRHYTLPLTIDLVVARYNEDVAWLRRVPAAVRVCLYDKSETPLRGATVLPNIGREAHTYLHHLCERYETLADLTVFTQGRPFDHAPDLHPRLRALARGEERVDGFRWFGFLIEEDDADGARSFQRWSKNPERRPLRMREFWRALFGEHSAVPPLFVFYGGAVFAVARDVALSRPRAFYERARDIAAEFPDAAHCFERVWDRIFGIDGIPAPYRNRPRPIYLKPIRRLTESAPESAMPM